MGASFDLEAFHESAVRTPSHADVGAMRELLVETLTTMDIDPRVDDAGNVLAHRGTGTPHLVLNTHLDTVSPELPVTIEADVLRGRGACDAKGPLAAMIDAFLGVEVTDGRVTIAVTPDEETHSTGAAALRGRLDPDACIVGEPTDLDVCHAARGRFEATVTLGGVRAHAADPDRGTNAVAAAEHALAAIGRFDGERGPGTHESLGRPTLVPTGIHGGEATNQVPGECRITVDRRSVPPETAAGFRDALADRIRQEVPTAVEVTVRLVERETPFLEPFATPVDEPLVRRLSAAAGGTVRPFGAATEASYFAAEAPTVIFGPGVLADEDGPVAHSDREYVRRADVSAAAAALRETVTAYVG